MTYPERIAARAADLRPIRGLLTVVAAPLYAVGFVLGLVVVVALWLYAAAAIGFVDARARGAK